MSVSRRTILRGAALMVSGTALDTAEVRAQTPDALGRLLTALRRSRGFSATFEETKRLAMLRTPLVSRGTLHFSPPAQFARHVQGAAWSSIVLNGDQLLVASATERREMPLAHSGAARPLLEGLVGLLAGDRRALERSFVTVYAAGSPWTLTLTPRSRCPVTSIEVTGVGDVLSGYRVREQSGDEAQVIIRDVDADRVYSRSDAERAFRANGP